MGLKEFKIIFDDPERTYRPGETLKAQIIVVLDYPQKYRDIKIAVTGEANTFFSKSNTTLDNKDHIVNDSKLLTAHEQYFSREFCAVENPSDSLQMSAGEHIYPFECDLPPNLPSSLESELGHVRYTIKATIDRPWKFDHKVEDTFKVLSVYDLNADSRAKKPVLAEKSQTFGCSSSTSSPLTVNFSSPVVGYVPGQSIRVKVDIENESGIEVSDVRLSLVKKVTYHVNTPQADIKTECFAVAKVSKGPIVGKGIKNYEQLLKVPPLQPSSFIDCSIIQVQYTLDLEACVEGLCNKNLRMSHLILIGTVPLANYESLMNSINDNNYRLDSKELYPSASAPPEYLVSDYDYLHLPPPSYEESIYGGPHFRKNGKSERTLLISL